MGILFEKFLPHILLPKIVTHMYISLVLFAASAATFSRFIPSVKTQFDYGAMIFILTFSIVAFSGYRYHAYELFVMASQRFSTIAVGISLCIIISMLFCPIWAGSELHNLIVRNLEKLADSLEGMHEQRS